MGGAAVAETGEALPVLAAVRGGGLGVAAFGGVGGVEPQETTRLSPTSKGRPTRIMEKAILIIDTP
jgi:hypothetical protein